MVPEEASYSASFSTYFQSFREFGLCKEPAKGPQKPSNALVRCLFRDSIFKFVIARFKLTDPHETQNFGSTILNPV